MPGGHGPLEDPCGLERRIGGLARIAIQTAIGYCYYYYYYYYY